MKINLRKQYRDLEMLVHHSLRAKINKSSIMSKYIDGKCIKVNLYNYTELTIVNENLTLLDTMGHHYSIFAVANLEDLIDILEDKDEAFEINEKRVYLVCVNNLPDGDERGEVPNWSDEVFIEEAKKQGFSYSLEDFTNAFNKEEVNSFNDFIRII